MRSPRFLDLKRDDNPNDNGNYEKKYSPADVSFVCILHIDNPFNAQENTE